MSYLTSRRRMLAQKGRPMTLRRTGQTDLTVQGYAVNGSTEQGQGAARQDMQTVHILNDEIATASWPGPPIRGDRMVVDSDSWAILTATPVYEGSILIGHKLDTQGGS